MKHVAVILGIISQCCSLEQQFGIFHEDVWILSIGSTSRPELQETQAETVGKHFKLITHNELTVEKCHVCEVGDGTSYPPGAFSRTSNKVSGKYHKIVSPGWWCAQKRIMPALQQVLDIPPEQLPSFMLVVDDDTFINPAMLQAFAQSHNADDYIFKGDVVFEHGKGLYPLSVRWRHPKNATVRLASALVGGGGGSFISRAVLLKLQPAIQQCVQNVQTGDWCDWHSDWSLSECILNSSNTMPIHSAPFFSQFWGLRRCHKYSVTCHGKMNETRLTELFQNYTGALGEAEMDLYHQYMDAIKQNRGNETFDLIHDLAFEFWNTTKMNDQSFRTLGVNPYGIYLWSSLISHAIESRLAMRPPLAVTRLEDFRRLDIEAVMERQHEEAMERKIKQEQDGIDRERKQELVKAQHAEMQLIKKKNSIRIFMEKQSEQNNKNKNNLKLTQV